MSSFTLNDKKYELVQSKFTFAEARAIEKVTGVAFGALMSDEKTRQSATVTQAMIWVSVKRVDPETKFSDLDDVAIDGIEFEADPVEAPDPTVPVEG